MLPLTESLQNDTVKILQIKGGFGFRQRMSELGIMPGNTVKIIKNDHIGPLIIMVKNSRIALGRGMCRRIYYAH